MDTLRGTQTPSTASVSGIAAEITAALVHAWHAIQARHPEVPDAVVSMATGRNDAAAGERAYFWANKWHSRLGEGVHHEVHMNAERLAAGAEEVFTSLLHESAHALNTARGKKDCSVSGYHNKEFRDAALELGMVHVEKGAYDRKKRGFSAMELGPGTAEVYAAQITALDRAIRATRTWSAPSTETRRGTSGREHVSDGGKGDPGAGGDTPGADAYEPAPAKEDRNYARAQCHCSPPTVIRASPRTLARRHITCGLCKATFA